MFDDLDDDDVTDLIPDSDIEKKEKEHRREQERRGRRMTVSEVSKVERNVRITSEPFYYFMDSGMNLSERCEMSKVLSKDFFVKIH